MVTSAVEILPEHHLEAITRELKLPARSVLATALLVKEGATVPFIARYRKEVTGSLDEVAIAAIADRMEKLRDFDARRDSILKSLEERNLLSADLKKALLGASTLGALEDIYQPYKPKKRTRATIAREAGLEPLADLLWEQNVPDPLAAAGAYVDAAKGVEHAEAALSGARDILAERASDDPAARARAREVYRAESILSSKVLSGKEVEAAKFKDYFDWQEPAAKAPSHRILAIRRGEKEGFLMMRIQPPEASVLAAVEPLFVRGRGPAAEQVRLAVQDGVRRLLGPAMETEIRLDCKARADEEAIRVFSENIRELLLASPLGQKVTLAIDPGFRTGCKVVILDRQGKLLHHDVVFPDQSALRRKEAGDTLLAFVKHFKVEAVAIGNGTAGRETETFVRALKLPAAIPIVLVNESGASIYSASDIAREEFPDKDITVRGAVSIGRRLMDPLAELVKLDPKSIGVGQYQHDVDQIQLKKSLDGVVMSCVNGVGVEVNTASKQLLTYVSGIGPQLAENIVKFRDENGPFRSRRQLLKVPRLGEKAFEQGAGFLRVREGEHPLDASAVHPESYPVVDAMAADLGVSVEELMRRPELQQKIKPEKYVTEKTGLPTLKDILAELARPGRDPRRQFEAFSFADGVEKISDLKPGMKLPGIVTNVTAFGAFVDIGVHQDGLVHISQLADTFVRDPSEFVKVAQKVQVTVMEVDIERARIALSMKTNPDLSATKGARPAPGAPRPAGRPHHPAAAPSRPAPASGFNLFDAALTQAQQRKQ
ncbi:MAG: Tex family protein [Candidatus Methylacidiphilales bacterium]|nr:Tex family protein [Candidatus Methylacidiphilales bacterium]